MCSNHMTSQIRIKPCTTEYVLCFIMFLIMGLSGTVYGAGGDFVSPFPVGDTQNGKQEATAMAVDRDGNTVVTGYRNLAGNADDDYYTASFKADGSGVSWSAAYNRAGGSDRATAVAIDSNNDVIVTGIAWNGSNKDIHTIKYNGATGAVIWQATFNGGSNADDYAASITVDSLNNIYVGGYTNAAGTDDYLVLAYNSTGPLPDGGPAWQVTYNGPANSTDKLAAISAGTGGIAVTGYSSNGASFDSLSIKYSYTGEKLKEWRHAAGGSNPCWGQYVRMDASGNVIITGFCFNGNDKDIYTARYNADTGTLVWEATYDGGANLDDEPAGLYLDAAGDVYLTGYAGTLTEGTNVYIVKYRNPESGTTPIVVWQKSFNSAADNTDVPVSITGDTAGNVYVTGYAAVGGTSDYQTVKYLASNGTLLWQKSFNGSNNRNDKPAGVGISSAAGLLAGEEVFVAGWSEQATVGDYDYYVVRHDVGSLNPPSGLAVGSLSKDGSNRYSVPLTWSDNSSNEENFIVERKQGEFGSYETVTTLAAGTVAFTDSNLDENAYYFYRVKAFNSASGNSNYSNEVRVLTLIVAPIPPVWNYLYNGRFDSDDFATAIAVGSDNHPVVTGYSLDYAPGYSEGTTSTDYYTVKLHKDTKAVIWSDQHDGGTNQEDDSVGITADSTGSLIVTGNSFQFPGGESENINSLYTLKYQSGSPATIIWKGQYNGPAKIDDRAKAIATAVDGSNTVALVGHGKRTPTNDDIYVLAYPANPELGGTGMALPLWTATPYDGGGNDYATDVAFDGDGNVFVTGYSETAQGSGVYRTFTAKYCGKTSPACAGKTPGEIIWSDLYAGSGENRARSLAVDNDGNAYVAGFGVNAGNGRDFLLIKYDGKAVPSDQRTIWARTSNGAAGGDDEAFSVQVDPIDNNVVVAGNVLTTVCAGEPLFCDNDYRIVRYAPDGSVVWTATYLRPSADDHVNAMALDISGNIFLVGHTGDGTTTDSMSVKYSYDSGLIGATVFDGAAHDFDESNAIAISSLGDAFVAGYSRNAGGSDDYLVYKVSGVPLQAPSPFTATPNYTSAILAWTDNSTVEDGFHLERKIGACTSESPWVALPVSPLAANSTSYTDPGLTIGQEYCYRVRTFRSSGETTRWIERAALMQTPPPPGSFAATSPNTTTVNLSWSDTTTNESGFEIQRCEGAACDFTSLDAGFPKFAAANAVNYSDTGACAGKTYRYRILSYKTNNAGTGNEWASAFTTLASPVSTATAPTPSGLAAAKLNESQIRLTWTTLTGDHTGFNIYECTVADCSSTNLIGTAAAAATSFIHYGLVPNSTHKYQVRAYKTAGCPWEGSAAGPVTDTTANIPPTLSATAPNTTQVNLSWNDTTGAETGFELQKCTSGDCTLDEHFTTMLTTGIGVTSYTDFTVCKSTTSKYRVRARNEGLSLRGGGAWTKRAKLTIANFQPLFQTRVAVSYLTGMKADFSDLRFFDASAKLELPYWIESKVDSTSAVVWVKTGPMDDIYMYYGNASAASVSSGSNTFDFFDDFTGTTIDTGKWTVANGASYYTQNNELISSGGSGAWNSGMYTTANFARPFVFEAKIIVTGGNEMMIGAKDTGAGINYTDFPYAVYLNGNINLNVYEDGNNRGNKGTRTLNVWDNLKLVVQPTGAKYYSGTSTSAFTLNYDSAYSTESPLKPGFTNVNRTFRIDDTRIRKYVATEPAVTIEAPTDWTGPFSDTWDGTYSNLATVVTPTPAAPASPVAQRISEAEIKVTWTDGTSDETGFYIDRCTAADCNEGSIVTTIAKSPNVQQLDDTGLSINSTYYYRVRAYKTATCGWDIPAASIVTAATTLLGPNNPGTTPSVTTACNDVRMTDTDGSSLLSYYIESGCNTSSTKLHVKVPSIPNGTKQVYLYYANPTAVAGSDGAGTWDFFDDFTGSAVDTGKWIINDGTGFTVANGFLHGTNTTGRLTSNLTLSAGQNVQAKVKVATLPTNGVATLGAYASVGANIGFLNHPGVLYYVTNGAYTSNPTTPPVGSAQSDWLLYTMILKDTATVNLQSYDLDLGTSYWNPGDLANASAGRRIALGRRYDSDSYNNQSYVADWDWVRIRKYASPAPSFTLLGTEEAGSFALAGGTWAVRRPLTLTHTGTALTNYQVTTYVDTTSLASDQISIAWTNRTATETGFIIERCTAGAKTNPDCDFSSPDPSAAAAAGASSYVDRSVVANRKYCYRVKAEKTTEPAWATLPSAPVCAVTSDLPAKPTLTVTPHETTMDLSWNDTATGENAYVIQRCKGSGCDIATPEQTFTVTPNQTTYSDSTVCSDTYTYRIKGVKYGTNAWESPFSDSVTQTTVLAAPPTLTSATRASDTQINLVWQDNTGDETGFEIDRCEGAACDFTTKTTLLATGNATTYSNTGLKPGVLYRYRVRAYKTGIACGWPSGYSGIQEATTTVAAPTGLSATAANTTRADLSWTDTVSGESAFALYRCKDAGCTPADISTWAAGNAVTYSDTGVCANSTYAYQVKATNSLLLSGSGGGCWSSRAPLTITNFQPNFLTRVTVTYDSAMKADFSDLRFYDLAAKAELPHWIETSGGGSANIWFKTGANNAITLYFGNPLAIAVSNVTNIFGAGMVGYWPFNEAANTTAGTTADLSGQGNALTLVNFAAPYGVVTGGAFGNALSLNGSSQYAKKDAPTGLPGGAVTSVEAWVYPKSYPNATYNGIISWGARACNAMGYAFSMMNTGRPNLATWCNDANPASGAAATLNAWNHVAVVQNGATVTFYVNGQKITSSLNNGLTPTLASTNLGIGILDYPGRYFNGLIDEVRIYSRELSDAEIASRYAASLPTVSVGATVVPGGGCADYHFDGPLSSAGTVVTPAIANRVADFDFENAAASWPTAVGTTTGTSFDATTYYSGKASFKLAATGATLGRLQAVSVLAGEQYVLSGYLKAALTAGTAQCDVQGTGIDSAGITIAFGNANNNAGWKFLSETVTIPAGTSTVNVRCFGNGSIAGSAWFDMVQLVPVNVMKLTATRVSEAQVNLAWNDIIPDENGFRIERCSLGTCTDPDFTQVSVDLAAGTTSYIDFVPAEGTYTYRVRAFKTATCGWTALSSIAQATASLTIPVVTATPVDTTRIDLSWTYTSASETGFVVERCEGTGCGGTDFAALPGILNPGSTAFSDTTVCNNVTYKYQVKAFKNGLSNPGGACWTRRKDLTVTNPSPTVPVRYVVTYDSDMKADYSDLRFYDAGAGIELPYWIESANGSAATVWIKTGASTTIQMYYGNTSATAVTNGSRVFDFFDDFTGTTLNAAKWTEVDTAANYFTQNNELISTGGPSSWTTGIYSTTNFARPFIFEAKIMDTGGSEMMVGVKNTGTGISYTNFTYATYYVGTGSAANVYEDGSSRGASSFTPPGNTWKYVRLEVLPTGAVYYAGDTSGSYSAYYTSVYSSASPLKVGFANAAKSFKMDNVRIRRYLAVQPSISATSAEVVLGECPVFAGQWTSTSAPAAATTPVWVKPGGLEVVAESDTRIKLTWTDGTNDESGFKIQRCQGSSCTPVDMVPPASVGSNATTYIDSLASASGSFCYRVAAFKNASCNWESEYTDSVCDLSFPQQTGDLRADPLHSRGVRLYWTDMAVDEDGYEIEIMTWNGLWARLVTLPGSQVTSYNHVQGLEPEKRYSYRVRPFRGSDKSPYSNIATVTTPAYTSSPPTCP